MMAFCPGENRTALINKQIDEQLLCNNSLLQGHFASRRWTIAGNSLYTRHQAGLTAYHKATMVDTIVSCCSVLHIANKCMEEDVPVFKYSIQDIVDELEASLLLDGSDLLLEWLLLAAVAKQLWCHMLHLVLPSLPCDHAHLVLCVSGNEEDMQAQQSQVPCVSLAVHTHTLQQACAVR